MKRSTVAGKRKTKTLKLVSTKPHILDIVHAKATEHLFKFLDVEAVSLLGGTCKAFRDELLSSGEWQRRDAIMVAPERSTAATARERVVRAGLAHNLAAFLPYNVPHLTEDDSEDPFENPQSYEFYCRIGIAEEGEDNYSYYEGFCPLIDTETRPSGRPSCRFDLTNNLSRWEASISESYGTYQQPSDRFVSFQLTFVALSNTSTSYTHSQGIILNKAAEETLVQYPSGWHGRAYPQILGEGPAYDYDISGVAGADNVLKYELTVKYDE